MNNKDRLIIDKEQLNSLVNSCQEEIRRLKEQLEAYENMRKEAIAEIEYFELQAQHLNDDIYLDEKLTQKLKDILNKVGGSDD